MNIATQLKRLGATPEMIAGTLVDGKPIIDMPLPKAGESRLVKTADRILLTIPGPAPGKPRQTRRDKWAKRPAVVRYRDWCDLVRSIAGEVPAAESVAELRWTAFFEPPKSWSKKKRCAAIGRRHLIKPDSSNILKGIEDTLWPDVDQALSDGGYKKRWDWHARLEIEIILVEKTQ